MIYHISKKWGRDEQKRGEFARVQFLGALHALDSAKTTHDDDGPATVLDHK
jgi:hypothetical protein